MSLISAGSISLDSTFKGLIFFCVANRGEADWQVHQPGREGEGQENDEEDEQWSPQRLSSKILFINTESIPTLRIGINW
jgi:hypothetical protein